MRTLQECYGTFLDKVIPDDAGDAQKHDMEIAFYAGALSTFQLMLKFADFPEDTAALMVDTLNLEILNKCSDIVREEPTLSSEPR